ncbi:MAG: outer membrane lipoprotein-sorting protein, partial [Pseudomonadota bacterium]
LEPATFMFAAIAIGLGVDFSIHLIDRTVFYVKERGWTLEATMARLFPTTGRALFFNFSALFFGFLCLFISELPTLQRFGAFISIGALASFVGGLILLPGILRVFRPAFAMGKRSEADDKALGKAPLAIALALGGALAFGVVAQTADAETPGFDLAERISLRDEGQTSRRNLTMILIDKSGKERRRETLIYRRVVGEDRSSVIYFTAPRNVKGTGFLTFDYGDVTREDDQWMYLPALRKTRRVPASDRGDYFLGTDLTYEDVKKDMKFALADFTFEIVGSELVDGKQTTLLLCTPKNATIEKQLGYSKVLARIDEDRAMPVFVEFWDVAGNPLKVIRVPMIENIDGIWTVLRLEVDNLKTGHGTVFEYSDVAYEPVDDAVFTKTAIERGL